MATTEIFDIKVLYVEDEVFVREPFSEMLRRRVKEVVIAKNGKEGIEMFKLHQPDVVISDIKMPLMDGLTMAREIRQLNQFVPIIITTAFEFKDFLMKSIEVGINKFLVKPIDRNALVKALEEMTHIVDFLRSTKSYSEFMEILFETQNRTIIVVDSTKLLLVNADFLDFFGFKSHEDFFTKYTSISHFFSDIWQKTYTLDPVKEILWLDSLLRLNGIENNTFLNYSKKEVNHHDSMSFRLFSHNAKLAIILHVI
jgi:two-component system cell cycle response regulator